MDHLCGFYAALFFIKFAQRLRCAAAILLRRAAEIVRLGLAFCFAHRAFCANAASAALNRLVGSNSRFNKTTLNSGGLELLGMNRPHRVVLIVSCLLLGYCCLWVPWCIHLHLPSDSYRPSAYVRVGYASDAITVAKSRLHSKCPEQGF